jgi:hypothetical protein
MLLMLALVASMLQTDSVSVVEARGSYPDFLKLSFRPIQGSWGISASADTLPTDHPLAGFVKERRQYLSYIAGVAVGHFANVDLSPTTVRDSIRRAYYRRLQTDTTFDRLILGPLAGYLHAHGRHLVGYSSPSPVPVPVTHATAVAARFFNPDILLPDGRTGVHICVAKHGLFESLGPRDIAVEAVAFAAVWDDTSLPDSLSVTAKDFTLALNRVKALPRNGSPAERIERAQDVMWKTFQGGEGLVTLLRQVTSRWPGLPFVLQP